MLDLLKKLVSYDAERDFYAKHFPSVLEDESIIAFRPMKKSDVLGICEIEKQVYNFPWSEKTFYDCFKAGYSSWVLERLEEIFAYGILSFGAGEAHIMNLCVSPAHQNKGHGQALLTKLIAVAIEYRAKSMLLEVRPSNTAAIRLYEAIGFNEIGTRTNYYPADDGREDALILGLNLATAFSEIKEQTEEQPEDQPSPDT